VVAFSVLRSTGSVLVSVEEGVTAQIAQLEETLPEDIEFQLIFTRATEIRDSYQASIDALIIGCILGGGRGGHLSSGLAGHPDYRDGAAPVHHPHLFVMLDWFGLHPQQHVPAGPDPGGGEFGG
jgi:hypothetical protein